jgi:GTP-binding protein EngB required for normal cell division
LHSAAVVVDRLLGEIEALAVASESPFGRYLDDLTPVQKQVLIAFTRAAHARMIGALRQLGVPGPSPSGSARSSARNALLFAEVALQEVEPSRLRGYGKLQADDAVAVERMLADVAASLAGLRECLADSPEADLGLRIASLPDGVAGKAELASIEQTVRDRGLVALRRSLFGLVEQVESDTYEIAVFGRVSSGKSSLLNAILEQPALPVGITPVTSVPTRLVWAESPGALVRFADAPEDQSFPIDELKQFVTEEHNAGNAKKVTRVTVELPLERLCRGVALVDTPGLGALATSGARETYAYMPRCDLGVIVVDGGGTFDASDVDVARALLDSGIEIEIVISKADRVAEVDRAVLARYVHDQLLGRLGVDLMPHWVSSVEPRAELARRWFDDIIGPRLDRSRELAASSVKRKMTTLRGLIDRAAQSAREGTTPALQHIGGEAARFLEGRRRALEDGIPHARDLALEVVRSAAAVLSRMAAARPGEVVSTTLLGCVDRERDELRRALLEVRDRLRGWIDEAAHAAGVTLDREAVALDLTTMPVVEPPMELRDFQLTTSRLAPWRERRIAVKLAERAGSAIESELHRFEVRLRGWTRSTLARLGGQFASQIEPLRGDGLGPAGVLATVEESEPSGVREMPED